MPRRKNSPGSQSHHLSTRVAALTSQFVRVIRQDLGAATADDAEIGARNQEIYDRLLKSESCPQTVGAESGG